MRGYTVYEITGDDEEMQYIYMAQSPEHALETHRYMISRLKSELQTVRITETEQRYAMHYNNVTCWTLKEEK